MESSTSHIVHPVLEERVGPKLTFIKDKGFMRIKDLTTSKTEMLTHVIFVSSFIHNGRH